MRGGRARASTGRESGAAGFAAYPAGRVGQHPTIPFEDPDITGVAVARTARRIRTGLCSRTGHVARGNRLTCIGSAPGKAPAYAGRPAFRRLSAG
jgi:enolase